MRLNGYLERLAFVLDSIASVPDLIFYDLIFPLLYFSPIDSAFFSVVSIANILRLVCLSFVLLALCTAAPLAGGLRAPSRRRRKTTRNADGPRRNNTTDGRWELLPLR